MDPDSRAENNSGWTPPQPPPVHFHAYHGAGQVTHHPADSVQGSHLDSHAHTMMAQSLLHTAQSCASMRDHTITVLLSRRDGSNRFQQIQNLRDCVRICNETTCSLAGQRPFARKFVKLCAKICYMCGHECLRHPDPESQSCGQMCLRCAEACKRFVMTEVQ